MQKQCEEKMGKKGTSSTSTGGTVFEGDMFVGCQNCDLAGEPNRTYNQSRWWYVVTHWVRPCSRPTLHVHKYYRVPGDRKSPNIFRKLQCDSMRNVYKGGKEMKAIKQCPR